MLNVAVEYLSHPRAAAATCTAVRAAAIASYGCWLIRRQEADELSAVEAMALAVRHGKIEAVEQVTAYNKKELNNAHMLKAFVCAAGRPRVVRCLLKHMLDREARAEAPNLLIAAVRQGCRETAEIAIGLGATPGNDLVAKGMESAQSAHLAMSFVSDRQATRESFLTVQATSAHMFRRIATLETLAAVYEGDPEARARAFREADEFCRNCWWAVARRHLLRRGAKWAEEGTEELEDVAQKIAAACHGDQEPAHSGTKETELIQYMLGMRWMAPKGETKEKPIATSVATRFDALVVRLVDLRKAAWPELGRTMDISKECIVQGKDSEMRHCLIRALRAALA